MLEKVDYSKFNWIFKCKTLRISNMFTCIWSIEESIQWFSQTSLTKEVFVVVDVFFPAQYTCFEKCRTVFSNHNPGGPNTLVSPCLLPSPSRQMLNGETHTGQLRSQGIHDYRHQFTIASTLTCNPLPLSTRTFPTHLLTTCLLFLPRQKKSHQIRTSHLFEAST